MSSKSATIGRMERGEAFAGGREEEGEGGGTRAHAMATRLGAHKSQQNRGVPRGREDRPKRRERLTMAEGHRFGAEEGVRVLTDVIVTNTQTRVDVPKEMEVDLYGGARLTLGVGRGDQA